MLWKRKRKNDQPVEHERYFYTEAEAEMIEAAGEMARILSEALVQIGISCHEAAEAFVRAFHPPLKQAIQPMLDIAAMLDDEREQARQRSRDDLQRKRRKMRGKNRHLLPTKGR